MSTIMKFEILIHDGVFCIFMKRDPRGFQCGGASLQDTGCIFGIFLI